MERSTPHRLRRRRWRGARSGARRFAPDAGALAGFPEGVPCATAQPYVGAPGPSSRGRLGGQVHLALALLCGFVLATASSLSAQAAGPCETDEGYRALDFLLGDWRLVSGGETVGRSRVEKLEDGCLIAETWSFVDGGSGRTWSSFDSVNGEWRRFTVSNLGVIVRSNGTVDGGELVFAGEYVAADGRSDSNWRERLKLEEDGRIARTAGTSRQAGHGGSPSTALFAGHYVPVGDRVRGSSDPLPPKAARDSASRPDRPVETAVEPTSPAAVEAPLDALPSPPASVGSTLPGGEPSSTVSPSPPAPAAGEVTPGSARAVDAPSIERIAMASPMVLRVPLGAVESLPEGYAWITRDAAPYLCEGVTIQSVQVERRVRRGRVALDVELAVHGIRTSQRVRVGIDLRRAGRSDGDAPVVSAAAGGRVGRSIPEQIDHGAVAFKLPLSLDAAAFDQILADAERPEIVITLTVGR